MKTFLEWVSTNNHELPVLLEKGSAVRAGIAWWAYPDAYIRSHYPDLYFTPYAADALQKMAPGPPITPYKHHVKHLTPPDWALGPNGEYQPEKEIEYETD
jgi:hypothetical protein